MRKRAVLLLTCIFSCSIASRLLADTFIVTSTADNGAGTLRDAISKAAANGAAITDYIHFNISQTIFNQRIIHLITPLPPLSSNLIIDGTTQPGQKFGTTDAKICVMKDDYAAGFTLFTLNNVSGVSIYGLYMYYGYQQGIFVPPYRSELLYAISLSNAFDIEIGAANKGNVINGYNFGIYSSSDSCRNVRIQSNYIGQGLYYEDNTLDIAPVVLPVKAAIEMINVKDVLIGGATAAEGNVIKAERAIGLNSRYAVDNGFIRIENNLIGKHYDRVRILGGQDLNCASCPNVFIGANQHLGPSGNPSMDYEVFILNNEIPTSLGIDKLGKKFIIKGNKFELPVGSPLFTSVAAKLTITNCADGEIGGATNAEANSFRQGGVDGITAISAIDNSAITISKNIFECNVLQASPTTIQSSKTTVPFVRINTMTATQVTGTATPNSTVEIFYDDGCDGCEGEVYIGATNADAAGNWSFAGAIARSVVATATTGAGTTGQFSVPETDDANVVLNHPGCGLSNGSITGIVVRGGTGGLWRDKNGNVISNSIDLLNVGAGQYTFFAKLGTSCLQLGGVYELVTSLGSIIDKDMVITPASCGNDNGSIEGLFADGASGYRWLDASTGNEVATGADLRNAAAGSYRLEAWHVSGCTVQSEPYTITRLPLPAIDLSAAKLIADTCNRLVGAITGISVTGNGISYKWLDASGQETSQQPEFRNIGAGDYRLEIKDANQCIVNSPVFTVTNINTPPAPPVYDNYLIQKGVAFSIQPLVTARGTYKIYDVPVGGAVMLENTSGRFDFPAIDKDIIYYVEIQDGDCVSARVPVEVKVGDETRIVAPNVFSPNGDGLNDTWAPGVLGILKLTQLRVYNRWGQVVFETTKANRRWDGTLNGNRLPVGTYYWILQGTDPYGKPISERGPVMIVR